MNIGLDFDNTIVSYDQIFYDVAIEWGVVPDSIPVNKVAVRNFLRVSGREDQWTKMQGYVYGARMDEAIPFPGVIEFIQQMKNSGNRVMIISHKTAHPFLGPKYDLHGAALHWIRKNIPLSDESVFFEPTQEKKIERIAELGCHVYIDDLPEIITSPNFPQNVRPFLFDPENTSWSKIQRALS